jgi:hypothetical protein
MTTTTQQKINFRFRPYEVTKGDLSQYAIEKAEGEGAKPRRYMQGIASGLAVDGHNERMSEKAISSFMEQFNSGNMLLYADTHGIQASKDIGIATKAEILDNGDWFVEFRLYDEDDGMGQGTLETIEKLWKQANGLPPYDKVYQKGFSIEGIVPPGGVIEGKADPYTGITEPTIIDDVQLDGVVLVPKPAYKESVAHAVYKCLGELHPNRKAYIRKTITGVLQDQVDEQEMRDQYWDKKWDINDATEKLAKEIMEIPNDPTKQEKLELLYTEYSKMMVDLLMASEKIFIDEDKIAADAPVVVARSLKGLMINLHKQLIRLRDIKKSQLQGTRHVKKQERKTLT